MKLVTFRPAASPRGSFRPGLWTDGGVVEIPHREGSDGAASREIRTALDVLVHERVRERALALWAELRSSDFTESTWAHDDIVLESPVPAPGKFICIGLNYYEHAREAGLEIDDVPTIFAKFNNAVTGSGQPIVVPQASHKIDWEGELGVLVGRRTRNVSADQALDFVAGYTVVNDITARDYQFKTSQWMLGKTFDTFGPIGPCVVDAAAMKDPQALSLRTAVNGELKQSTSTSDMVFPVATLLAFLSTIMTLEPGDIVSTGTPSGIGALQQPRQWLRPGDTVDVSIEGIGTLTNPVVAGATDEDSDDGERETSG